MLIKTLFTNSCSKYVIAFWLVIVGIFLFLPGFPWSSHIYYKLDRLIVKAKIELSKLKGQQPKPISLSGKLIKQGAINSEAVKGAEIIAVESISDFATMSNNDGRFTLPYLIWYPGAVYNLFVRTDLHHTSILKIEVPLNYQDTDIVDIGELVINGGDEANEKERAVVHRKSVSHIRYDSKNDKYYKDLFNGLTVNAKSDHEKISTVNKYVAAKLNYNESTRRFESPRQILEKGSHYCGSLALAMATLLQAGNYPVKVIDMSDTPQYLNTHVVVEVFYDDKWHIYDPTYGIFFINKEGIVASYKDIRLNADLITFEVFQSFKPQRKNRNKRNHTEVISQILSWMPKVFSSGFHNTSHITQSDLCNML